jgi:hypothetical protein
MTAVTPDSDRIKVYPPKQSKQWRLGVLSLGLGLLGIFQLRSVLDWLSGGPMPDSRTFMALLSLLFVPFGILLIVNGLRGFPRLTITPEGVKFDSSVGARWARWNSLDPFEVSMSHAGRFNKPVLTGTARIVGPNASKAPLRQKSFSVPDAFLTPISTIVDELKCRACRSRWYVRIAVGGDE